MRVFIVADIEGIAGVAHGIEGATGNPEYERARRLMTEEANALIRGIFEAAPDSAVTVADSHGPYRNLIPEEMDERAVLSRGKPRLYGMVDGIDQNYDVAMMVGVHGQAGSDRSVLSHTFTGTILDVRLNGTSMGELGLNAALAGAHGVPVVLISGDQSVVAEAKNLLGDAVEVVQVKESRGHLAIESLHPNVARAKLQAAAKEVVSNPIAAQPFVVEEPVAAEVDFARPVLADLAELIDGVQRVNGRTVRFERPSMLDTYRVLRLMTVLCSTTL